MSTKNLVIVESPAKARTIEKYLGKDYTVLSSFGHIRDLPTKGMSIDKENGFTPTYEIPVDKKKVVAELKKQAKGATVWLASDEDREGEAISWHLCEALKLDPKTTKRIVFHEITKNAILEAIKQPRTVDLHLVDAQQARRVLDRLVGYELSPVLWKKVRPGLSAGRVQSVAVRIIVEREREIKAFESESSFKIFGTFTTSDKREVTAERAEKLASYNDALSVLASSKDAVFSVVSIDQKPGSKNPSAPFTTSTLQQEASRRLGYGVRQTMTLAQRLYENGHITYMRTDSTNLSGQAIAAASDYITSRFGKEYHQVRQFKTKNASAQEAHEAIRPTSVASLEKGADAQQQKLYKLIWQRFIASQMAPASIQKTEVTISASGQKIPYIAKGEVLQFDGFLAVYGGGKDDVILPQLAVGDTLLRQTLNATEVFSRGPARFSEASLVKALEEMGIGRPSTYAPTISTIQTRGYVEKTDLQGTQRSVRHAVLSNSGITEQTTEETTGADKGKLLPTALAEMTTDFLVKYFAPIVDFDFTAKAEAEFDLIAEGKTAWNSMIADFYTDFKPLISASADVSRAETSQSKTLGTDPKTGKPVIARFGRFGPMLQLGEVEGEEEKPKFAPLPEGTTLDSVTFEQAIEMFKLPRVVGTTEDGREIKANVGRFGPYIVVGKLFVSIKPHGPLDIDEQTARTLITEKENAAAENTIADFGTIRVLKGRYGPYITDGKKNAKIPKDTKPEKITEAQAKILLAEAPAKGKGRRFTKKAKK
ncbi:type I DNA topoisomerase [bacterium]|nr:type I DNA topoisomerase [bacterium]NBX97909.1 type I DNA topoisomerase [bacterium]NDC93851.1 type I DNA topoisomerase [bacterium]NDD82798.1 type I DNA topoisomerase [bacterium]NDG30090.1 type I DNA topoisomerase [bacterium]